MACSSDNQCPRHSAKPAEQRTRWSCCRTQTGSARRKNSPPRSCRCTGGAEPEELSASLQRPGGEPRQSPVLRSSKRPPSSATGGRLPGLNALVRRATLRARQCREPRVKLRSVGESLSRCASRTALGLSGCVLLPRRYRPLCEGSHSLDLAPGIASSRLSQHATTSTDVVARSAHAAKGWQAAMPGVGRGWPWCWRPLASHVAGVRPRRRAR